MPIIIFKTLILFQKLFSNIIFLSYYNIVFENQKKECPVFKGLVMEIINCVAIKILKIRNIFVKILKIKKRHAGSENYKKVFEKRYKIVIEKRL